MSIKSDLDASSCVSSRVSDVRARSLSRRASISSCAFEFSPTCKNQMLAAPVITIGTSVRCSVDERESFIGAKVRTEHSILHRHDELHRGMNRAANLSDADLLEL